jgi:LPXTG-motif cell wall-anchored protein
MSISDHSGWYPFYRGYPSCKNKTMKRNRLPLLFIGATAAVALLSPSAAFAGAIVTACSSTTGQFSIETLDPDVLRGVYIYEITRFQVNGVDAAYTVANTGPNGTQEYTTVNPVPPGARVEVDWNLMDPKPYPVGHPLAGQFFRGGFTKDVFPSVPCPNIPPPPPTTIPAPPTTEAPAPTTAPAPTVPPVTNPAPTTVPGTPTTLPLPILPTLPAPPTTLTAPVLPATGSSGFEVPMSLAAAGLVLGGSMLLFKSKRNTAV